MKTILVTGGAGYIGSHACKALARAGYRPVVFDNLSLGHRWAVRWGPFEHGDLLDRAALDRAFGRHRPEAVIHFAGAAYVGESVEDPGKYYLNNVAGSLRLLEAMRDWGVPHLVFSSSCATYGPYEDPITESFEQRPINPYGATKLMVERMIDDFGRAHGLRAISLRYFNAAGADPEVEIGEDHTPETHLIPLALQVAAGQRPHVTLLGDTHATADGSCVRDFIHVSDLAQAHVLALGALEGGCASTAYNLANGQGFSVREVIAAAAQVTGRDIPVVVGAARPGDPPRLVGDASRIADELGWRPAMPELPRIIESAWRWHRRSRA